MIARSWDATWRNPNLSCRVKDPNGVEHQWVLHAASAEDLRSQLELVGYEVVGLRVFSFSDWQQGAADKSAALAGYGAGVEMARDFDREVWSVLKAHLFDLFAGRCAFCDSGVLAVAAGDVEHFRPKRKVKGDSAHPGYYWLAYEPTNLLPTCEICNRSNKKGEFPVEEGTRAYDPDGMLTERPLLLNPYFDDPARDLACDDLGVMKGTTPRGVASVEVYGLNRPPLVERRCKAICEFQNKYKVRMTAAVSEPAALVVLNQELRRGDAEYSGAMLSAYLRILRERLVTENAILAGEDPEVQD